MIIVVVTLIAAVAVGGYIVGTIGQSQNTAQVGVTGTFLKGGDFQAAGTTAAFSCISSALGSWISVANYGSSVSFVTGVTITWAGGGNTFSPSGTCPVGPAGSGDSTTYLAFPPTTEVGVDAIGGQSFTGSVSVSNGAVILFSGSWQ